MQQGKQVRDHDQARRSLAAERQDTFLFIWTDCLDGKQDQTHILLPDNFRNTAGEPKDMMSIYGHPSLGWIIIHNTDDRKCRSEFTVVEQPTRQQTTFPCAHNEHTFPRLIIILAPLQPTCSQARYQTLAVANRDKTQERQQAGDKNHPKRNMLWTGPENFPQHDQQGGNHTGKRQVENQRRFGGTPPDFSKSHRGINQTEQQGDTSRPQKRLPNPQVERTTQSPKPTSHPNSSERDQVIYHKPIKVAADKAGEHTVIKRLGRNRMFAQSRQQDK